MSGNWNVNLVQSCFLVDDVDMILSIPSSRSNVVDSLLWHYEKNGMYSVCNGYWVGRALSSNPCSSGLDGAISWWKSLWRLKLPQKIKDLELLCVVFCRIWFCRNHLVHNLSSPDMVHVVNWASGYIDEWRSAQEVLKPNPIGNSLLSTSLCPKWKPLDFGMFKINTDAATSYSNHSIATTVHNGILLAISSGLFPLHIETDSLQVVNLVLEGGHSSADVGPVIDDILKSCSLIPSWTISHVPRKSNLVVHNLAKMSLSAASDCVWLNRCPPCVENFVLFDASGRRWLSGQRQRPVMVGSSMMESMMVEVGEAAPSSSSSSSTCDGDLQIST
ncbi:hypothetical protein LWI29_036812 [Acer saccharum]|uniref:RNase H type-1 domain-containing protein n=1 Tax=Acer saccharum TaxID=4024 RepID=A0AA39TC19_ACESA|nr:hypothetical protein LWI29_036812 [Acer saccharum]